MDQEANQLHNQEQFLQTQTTSLTMCYSPMDKETVRTLIQQKMKAFLEEARGPMIIQSNLTTQLCFRNQIFTTKTQRGRLKFDEKLETVYLIKSKLGGQEVVLAMLSEVPQEEPIFADIALRQHIKEVATFLEPKQ